MRECKSGPKKGQKYKLNPELLEYRKVRDLEAQIEKFNNGREKRLRKIRFELTLNRTDISSSRKYKLIEQLSTRYEKRKYREKLLIFNKLLGSQKGLIPGGVAWWKKEDKLQELIDEL